MVSTPNIKKPGSFFPNFTKEALSKPLVNLAKAESGAVKNTTAQNFDVKNTTYTSKLRQTESNLSREVFTNNVIGKKISITKNQKSLFKKYGPIGALLIMLIIGFFALSTPMSLLGAAISANYTSGTDVQYTSYSLRNTRIMSYMIDGGNQVKISNFTKRYTTFTPYMKERLKKNGIQVGYIDTDGNFRTNQIIANSKTVLKYGDEIIDANSFQTKYAGDSNFRESYYNAKRGRVAGFFDDAAEKWFKKIGITRNAFSDFKQTSDTDVDAENFKNIVSEHTGGVDATLNSTSKVHDDETNTDTDQHLKDNIKTNDIAGDTAKVKAREMVNGIAGRVSNVGNYACSGLRVVNMAAIIAASYQSARAINYYLTLTESISKTMAGEGSSAAINETLTYLTKSTSTEVEYLDDDGIVKTKTVTGSPMESSGAKLMMSGSASSSIYSDVSPYSVNSVLQTIKIAAATTGGAMITCDGAMAASAIVSLASLAVPGGPIAKIVINTIEGVVVGIAIAGIVELMIEAIVPQVAKIFIEDTIENYTGIAGGEFYTSGAAASNFKRATYTSAYMPASIERVKQQNHETVIALAQEKEIDRQNRSPFDISSTNTFLGSVLSKFTYTTSTITPITTVSSIKSGVASSIASILPGAYAEDEVNLYTSHYQDCDQTGGAMTGTACDIYGNTIPATDLSTVDISPDDPAYIAALEPNLKYSEDGEQSIKKDSELAKFVNYCVNRESPWGVTDANIINSLSTDGGIILNNLPILNDVLDIVNFVEEAAYQDWATGKNCINSADNPRWDNEFKYYQRYIEDMRILGDMEDSTGGTNPVIAYMNNYEEEHPIDTSFEGTLARISGYTKNDIAFLEEYVRYSAEIANYDPSSRLAFGESENPFEHGEVTYEKTTTPSIMAVVKNTENLFIDRKNYLL